MHYFIIWKLPYISVCASRRLIVINSGMIILIATTSIKNVINLMKSYFMWSQLL